jgi:putative transposase
LNEQEWKQWCQKLNLSSKTCETIAAIRAAPPSRRVQGRAKNVSGIYPSRKMGQTIQFESHTVELWAIYQMEHDPDVLEFYDQPPPFLIQYRNKAGRKIGHYHTPDFFVLLQNSAGWEEWKTEEQLQLLAEKYPSRYQRTSDGQWRCPPGESHAEQEGLFYRVRSSAELEPIFIQNLMFLEDYLRFNLSFPSQNQKIIDEQVKATPGVTIAKLLAENNQLCADDVYAMIANEQLYADLYAAPLIEHRQVQLYLDESIFDAQTYLKIKPTSQLTNIAKTIPYQLDPNTTLVWDGRLWTLLNLGETTTTLLPEVGLPIQCQSDFFLQLLSDGTISIPNTEFSTPSEAHRLMDAASPADLSSANRRFQKLQAYFQHQTEQIKDIAPRTLRDWAKKFRSAEVSYGCGYVGLLPRTAKRGNRTPKAPPEAKELLDIFIAEHFETPRIAPAASVYRAYSLECQKKKIQPLSLRTFYKRLKQRRSPERTELRSGAKAAYNNSPWVWELSYSTPRHGDRPFAIVHIDHTQLDIELRSMAYGRLLGRPWLTMLIDAYSRRILAVYLTFDAPSYRSCMMGLRICVQRFGRLPQALVVDGGKEFHSIYFDTLLARYHCTKKTRPGAKPRFGSVIERLFGTTNTEFIFNLLGNTQASKQPRLLTSSLDPKRQAVWTLADLNNYLKEWAYSIYDQNEHEALAMSPRSAYELGLANGGERSHRLINYDEEFLMATRPSTRKGDALVQPGKGIKVNYLYYWSDSFRSPEVERTRVPVRYDPFDVGVAYAYINEGLGCWVKCISQYYSVFSGRSEKELLLASTEIRQQRKLASKSTNISAHSLAEFLSNVQEHETLLRQRLRDLEAKQILEGVVGSLKQTSSSNESPQEPVVLLDFTSTSVLESIAKKETSPQFDRLAQLDLTQLPIFEEYK